MKPTNRAQEGRDFVLYFSPWNYWERENRSQPLARAMADAGVTVLYVNYPLAVPLADRVYRRLRRPGVERIQENLYHTLGGPLAFSYDWRDLLHVDPARPSLKQRAFVRYVAGLIRQPPFRGRPVRVLSSRMISSLFVARYGAQLHALDIEDPWSRFHAIWRVPEAALLPALKRFGAGADVAVANGSRIARLAEAEFVRVPVTSLTNALDPVKLQVAGAQERPLDYPAGRSVLFSGPVDGRIDFRLLQPAFERFSEEVQFVFVGSVSPHWTAEAAAVDARYANVHFLGHRPIERLGAYLRQADLFMIPYCTDDAWTYVFPAKIYEYFAFGREVLGTFPIPDLPALLRSALHVTPTAESFMAALEAGLRSPGPREELAARAREETWGARAEVLLELLGLPRRDGARRDSGRGTPWPRERPSVSVGEDLVQP